MSKKSTALLPEHDPERDRIGTFFMDSGAHSLYTREILDPLRKLQASTDPADKKKLAELLKDKYKYYRSQAFWDYVDEYANFIKEHKEGIDYYVTVDAIFNPDISWDVLKYMENKHKLNPVPVVHYGAPMEILERHIKAGYEYIGIGGLGQEVKVEQYKVWANKAFKVICPKSNGYKPIVRTHGFAMTAYELMIRYPWWSVDSASWVKAAGFGMLNIPKRWAAKYKFYDKYDGEMQPLSPYTLNVGIEGERKLQTRMGPELDKLGIRAKRTDHKNEIANRLKMSTETLDIVKRWCDEVEVPLGMVDAEGKMTEWGVISHYGARMTSNLRFFEMLAESLPKWPWKFHRRGRVGFR